MPIKGGPSKITVAPDTGLLSESFICPLKMPVVLGCAVNKEAILAAVAIITKSLLIRFVTVISLPSGKQ